MGEVLTLQCGKSPHAPVLLLDQTLWQGMLDWMRGRMLGAGLIAAHDLDRLLFCNRPEEAISALLHAGGRLHCAA